MDEWVGWWLRRYISRFPARCVESAVTLSCRSGSRFLFPLQTAPLLGAFYFALFCYRSITRLVSPAPLPLQQTHYPEDAIPPSSLPSPSSLPKSPSISILRTHPKHPKKQTKASLHDAPAKLLRHACASCKGPLLSSHSHSPFGGRKNRREIAYYSSKTCISRNRGKTRGEEKVACPRLMQPSGSLMVRVP